MTQTTHATPHTAVALDMDGTFVRHNGTIAPHVVAGLRALARERTVVLASGRMLPSMRPTWELLGLTTPVIGYNGAKIGMPTPDAPPIVSHTIPNKPAREAIQFVQEHGWHVNLYIDEQVYVYSDAPEADWYGTRFEVPIQNMPPELDATDYRPTKLLVIVDEEQLPATYAAMRDRFPIGITLTTSSRRFVEVLPTGISKGAALRELAEHLGIPIANWLAAGDGMNDLEMLETAGYSYAISDGEPALHHIANEVIPQLADGGLEIIAARLGVSLPPVDSV